MPYIKKDAVSKSARLQLTEFSDAFSSAIVTTPTDFWAQEFGYVHSSSALETLFPLPLDCPGFKRSKNDMKFRRLYTRMMRMSTVPFEDGVAEQKSLVESDKFLGWADQPAKIAQAWKNLPNDIIAEMLYVSSYNGPLLDLYRDFDSDTVSTIRLFSNAHLINPLIPQMGTFTNYTTTTVANILSGAFFEAAEQHFNSLKGFDGRSLGLSFSSMLVPQYRKMTFKKALEHDTLIRAVSSTGGVNEASGNVAAVTQNNIFQSLSYRVASELLSNNYFYCFGAYADGSIPAPWIVQQESAPEEYVFDGSSEHYKNTGEIKIGYRGQANGGAALPHGILRVEITA